MKNLRYIYPVLALLTLSLCVNAQQELARFGQNRVQYKKIIWSFYETDNFNIYFYQGGQDLGKYIILTAEDQLEQITEKLDFNMRMPIDVLVYHDLSDLNQSNIGVYEEPQNIGGTTQIIDNKIFLHFRGDHEDLIRQLREGITRIYLQKLMVGSSFQEVVQNAVLLNLPPWFVEGLVSYMGGRWDSENENRLKHGILSGQYKKWKSIKEEDLNFIGHSLWHYVEMKHGKAAVSNLLYLTRVNRSVEHGFMFVLGKSVNETFNEWYRYYTELYRKELESFKQPDPVDHVKLRYRKHLDYFALAVKDDEEYIAYATDVMGFKKIYVKNLQTGKRRRILRYGFKTKTIQTNQDYPLIQWEPDGDKVSVIYNVRDKIKFLQFDTDKRKKETRDIRKFQKIYDFAYAEDNNHLLISGMQKGQCDLFKFYIPSTNTTNLTNDIYDDRDPAYVKMGEIEGYVFSSNRTSDTLTDEDAELDSVLPESSFDLFLYDRIAGGKTLHRVTNTPGIDESAPADLGSNQLVYLSDENGIRNRYAARLEASYSHDNIVYYYSDLASGRMDSIELHEKLPIDSAIDMEDHKIVTQRSKPVYKFTGVSRPLSSYSANIMDQDVTPDATAYSLYFDEKKGRIFFVEKLDTSDFDDAALLPKSNWGSAQALELRSGAQQAAGDTTGGAPGEQAAADGETRTRTEAPKGSVFYFQSPYDHLYEESDTIDDVVLYDYDRPEIEELLVEADPDQYKFTKTKTYRVKFYTEKVVSQMDNRILMTSYQPFDPNNPVFNNPDFGGLFEVGITDLLENHKVRGGFKIPTSFDETEFYISYENLKKRLDKKILFYRRTTSETTSADNIPFNTQPVPAFLQNRPFYHQKKTNYVEASFKYAINIPQSIRFVVAARNDQYVHKAQDNFTLNLANFSDNWIFTRVGYVFDNTIDIGVNLKNGSRFNVFFEFHKQIPTAIDTIGNFEIPLPQFNDAFFTVSGFDFRHYQKIHRNIVWATRVSGATSWGTRKMIFYLGGINNWLLPEFDRQTQVNLENDYAFQTLAAPMRGFKQNVRNGNNYLAINTEIRFPVFSYLIKSPIKSEFIKNFHIVGFTDVGTAWEFGSPFKRRPFIVAEFPDIDNLPDPNNDPAVVVEVEKLKNPIVTGFGTGIRATLFGYFIRTDVSWGWDSGIISSPVWYISLGFDF